MACRPAVPSDPAPDKRTPIALSFWSSAIEMKKRSIGLRRVESHSCAERWRTPSLIRIARLGGTTYIRSAMTLSFALTSLTSSRVQRARISERWLLNWGARCGTSTNAMPGSRGSAFRRSSNALSPPAEAPMATMGNVPRRFDCLIYDVTKFTCPSGPHRRVKSRPIGYSWSKVKAVPRAAGPARRVRR